MIKLIEAIQDRRSPFIPDPQENEKFSYVNGFIPYIFMCASSGTDKT